MTISFFDFEEPFLWFLLDYMACMGTFVSIGHYGSALFRNANVKKVKRRQNGPTETTSRHQHETVMRQIEIARYGAFTANTNMGTWKTSLTMRIKSWKHEIPTKSCLFYNKSAANSTDSCWFWRDAPRRRGSNGYCRFGVYKRCLEQKRCIAANHTNCGNTYSD